MVGPRSVSDAADASYTTTFHGFTFGSSATSLLRVPYVCGRFGRKSGHVRQYDKDVGDFAAVPIARAAQRPGFYAIPGATPNRVERTLGQLEGGTAPIVRRFLDLAPGHYQLPTVDRVNLATYVALLYVRTPARRDPDAAFAGFSKSIFADMDLGNPERFVAQVRAFGDRRTAEELETIRVGMHADLGSGRVRIEPPPLPDDADDARLAVTDLMPLLRRRRWSLVRVTEPRLVLGDEPVTIATPPNYHVSHPRRVAQVFRATGSLQQWVPGGRLPTSVVVRDLLTSPPPRRDGC